MTTSKFSKFELGSIVTLVTVVVGALLWVLNLRGDVNSLKESKAEKTEISRLNGEIRRLDGIKETLTSEERIRRILDEKEKALQEFQQLIEQSKQDLQEINQKKGETLQKIDEAKRAALKEIEKIANSIIEDWHTPTLENGWTKYHVETYNSPGYFKDSQGVVHLKGLVKNGEIGKTIFTLPEGYRPSKRYVFSVATANNVMGRVDVFNTGKVDALGASQEWLSLDGISFKAEQ